MFGVVQSGRPHFADVEFFDAQNVVVVVVVQVEIGGIEIAVFGDDQNHVVVEKFAYILSAFVDVQPQHVGIEPNGCAAECRSAFLFEQNFVHVEFGEYVAHRLPSFDGYFRKIFFEHQIFDAARGWSQGYFDGFGFAVGVGREIDDF